MSSTQCEIFFAILFAPNFSGNVISRPKNKKMEDFCMFKKLCKLTIVLLLAVMVSGVFAGNAFAEKKQYTGRTWEYVNFTALLSPNWAFVVMPGHRYEYYRHDKSKIKDGEHTLQTFMYELFVGPVYIKK